MPILAIFEIFIKIYAMLSLVDKPNKTMEVNKMTNKKIRIASVIITVLVLLSAMPITAFAGVKLTLSDSKVTFEPPTISPNVFDYGKTYGELEITGGAVYYNGEKVEGTFTFGSKYQSRVVPVATTEAAKYARLYFMPTDTSAYVSENLFAWSADYGIENWPTITVNPMPVDVVGSFEPISVEKGTVLETIQMPDTVKVYQKGTTEEVPGSMFGWVSRDDVYIGGNAVTESGVYTYAWRALNYEYLYFDVQVNVIAEAEITVAPTLADPDLTVDKVQRAYQLKKQALTGGEAMYDGQVVSGLFTWVTPNESLKPYYGKGTVSFPVKFVPDDTSLTEAFANVTAEVSFTMPDKIDTPITFTSDEITVMQGVGTETSHGYVYSGYELGPIFTGAVFFDWGFDISQKQVGEVIEDVEITVYVQYENAYLPITVTKDIRIVKRQISSDFGHFEVKNNGYQEIEGLYQMTLSYNEKYGKTGTVTIKVNGEVLEEGIEPTYKVGESEKYHFIMWTAPKSGTYTFTAEYIPGENDECDFKSNVIEVTLDIVVRRPLNITAVNCSIGTGEWYAGDHMNAKLTIDYDDFAGWEVKDSSGKVLSAEELGITEEQLKSKNLRFYLPDDDLTITAKKKGVIIVPTTPGDSGSTDGGFSFASIWASIVEFFTGLKDISVFSWLARLFELIWAFITGFVNGLAE